MRAVKHVWNQLSIQHAVTALRVPNFLSADAADLKAHITVNGAPRKGHVRNVVHTVADEKRGSRHRSCRQQKSIDLFGQMLTVRIEKNPPRNLSILSSTRRIRSGKPVRESGLNCFAFAAVLIVNDNFGTGFARALSRLVG